MRWVKHMATSWQDEKIAKLVKAGGAEGLACYGLWWRVLEIVALQVDGHSTKCSVTYDVGQWSVLLSLRGSHVRQWLSKLEVTGLVTVKWDASDIQVTIPKLLKYRDEYSKKSGQKNHDVPTLNRSDSDSDSKKDSHAHQEARLKQESSSNTQVPPSESLSLVPDPISSARASRKAQIQAQVAEIIANPRPGEEGIAAALKAGPDPEDEKPDLHFLSKELSLELFPDHPGLNNDLSAGEKAIQNVLYGFRANPGLIDKTIPSIRKAHREYCAAIRAEQEAGNKTYPVSFQNWFIRGMYLARNATSIKPANKPAYVDPYPEVRIPRELRNAS